MSDEILAKLDELKAGQDALKAGQKAMGEEMRSELTAIRHEVNDKFDLVVQTLEALSAHLGLRRAS